MSCAINRSRDGGVAVGEGAVIPKIGFRIVSDAPSGALDAAPRHLRSANPAQGWFSGRSPVAIAGGTLDKIDHVCGSMGRQQVMRGTRSWRDVARHLAGLFKLLIRRWGEQGDHKVLQRDNADVQRPSSAALFSGIGTGPPPGAGPTWMMSADEPSRGRGDQGLGQTCGRLLQGPVTAKLCNLAIWGMTMIRADVRSRSEAGVHSAA
jgi:hypothetical protein